MGNNKTKVTLLSGITPIIGLVCRLPLQIESMLCFWSDYGNFWILVSDVGGCMFTVCITVIAWWWLFCVLRGCSAFKDAADKYERDINER